MLYRYAEKFGENVQVIKIAGRAHWGRAKAAAFSAARAKPVTHKFSSDLKNRQSSVGFSRIFTKLLSNLNHTLNALTFDLPQHSL